MADENQPKVCPLAHATGIYTEVGMRCQEAGCAWWDERNLCCAVLSLAQNLYYLRQDLIEAGFLR